MSSVIWKIYWIAWLDYMKSSESKGRSSVEKMEGDGEFDNKQKYSIKDERQCL